jgi:hypothetical protein
MMKQLKNSFLRLVRRSKTRFEVMSLMTHVDWQEQQLKEAQDDGWEICGEILLKNKSGWCGDTYFHIPMRRRV